MPMPKPKNDESKDDFLNRCMSDSVMNDEYEDDSQRYAICNNIWDDKRTLKFVKLKKGQDVILC